MTKIELELCQACKTAFKAEEKALERISISNTEKGFKCSVWSRISS